MQNSLHQNTMKKILVLVNPKARQGHQVQEEITAWLKENDYEVLDHNQRSGRSMVEVIDYFAKENPIVLVSGGDGSVREALPALIRHNLPLLLIPSGTANNLARTLNIPTNIKDALELLKTGQIQSVDTGIVNGIPFMNVVGLGLSTQVNRVVQSDLKRWLGVFAFILTAIKVVLRMTPFWVQLEFDGKIHSAFSWQVSICNGRNYGNGLVIHKDASLEDGTLHGLSTESKKWWHSFVLIPALITGKFKREDDVTSFSGQTIQLRTKRTMHVDVDGDVRTTTPLKIRVLPRSLNIFAPVESPQT